MEKNVKLYFLNNKGIVRTVDYNFCGYIDAKEHSLWMCLGYDVVSRRKIGVIAVVPAEWRDSSSDEFITYDCPSNLWFTLYGNTPEAYDFNITRLTEKARFFSLHPQVPVTNDEDKALVKLYGQKQAYQDAVIVHRGNDEYRAYLMDAYHLKTLHPDLSFCFEGKVMYTAFPTTELENKMQALTAAGYRVAIEEDVIKQK